MLGPFGLHPKGTMRARALPAARALAARGHTVSVLMPPWHTPAEAPRSWTEPGSGVSCQYVSLSGLRWPVVGHLALAVRMARRARSLAPDVVHAFKPKAYSGLAADCLRAARLRAARLGAARPRAGPALVMDSDDWEGPGGWNDLEPYTRAQRMVFALQERRGMRTADALTVASRHLQTLALSVGVAPGRVHYLPNALGALPPERAHDPHPPTLLLYTRFFEFDTAQPLEVLARVRRTLPDTRLLVVGRGLFGEEARLAAVARSMGLAQAVDDRGWLEPEDAATAMAAGDVALYPFADTLVNRTKSPVKLLELMGSGLPVVGHAVGEIAEAIEHRRSGWLVPPGDTEAMAAAAARLLGDPALRARLGQGARARVADAYLWARRVVDLERAYAAAGCRS